jgi:hypothetical protein
MTVSNRGTAGAMGALVAVAIVVASASVTALVDRLVFAQKRAVVGFGETVIAGPDGAELLVSVEFRADGRMRWRPAGAE